MEYNLSLSWAHLQPTKGRKTTLTKRHQPLRCFVPGWPKLAFVRRATVCHCVYVGAPTHMCVAHACKHACTWGRSREGGEEASSQFAQHSDSNIWLFRTLALIIFRCHTSFLFCCWLSLAADRQPVSRMSFWISEDSYLIHWAKKPGMGMVRFLLEAMSQWFSTWMHVRITKEL